MSWQATAWAVGVKTGSSSRKALLMTLCNYMSAHEDEADGFLCGYPGQELLAEEAEMSLRSAREHLNGLCAQGLIQRKMRFSHDGTRTSDWYRIPVKPGGTSEGFVGGDQGTAGKHWPVDKPPVDNPPDAESAGSANQDKDSTNMDESDMHYRQNEHDHRQTAAGYKRDLDKRDKTSPLPPTETNATHAADTPIERAEEEPQTKTQERTETEKRLIAIVPPGRPMPSAIKLRTIAQRVDAIVNNVHRYGLKPDEVFNHLAAGMSNAQCPEAVWHSRLYDDALPVRRQKPVVAGASKAGVAWCERCASPQDRRLFDRVTGFWLGRCPACG